MSHKTPGLRFTCPCIQVVYRRRSRAVKQPYHVAYVFFALARGEATASRGTTWAAAAAVSGGLLGFAGVLSLVLAPESPYGLLYQSGTLGAFLREWAGPASHVLTTLSLGGVLAPVGGLRSRLGIVGGLVALASLVAMLGIFVYQAFILDPMLRPWAGPPLFLIIAGYAAFVGEPAALLMFGFAALRAGKPERWGLLLLALGALEAAPLMGYDFMPSWPFPDLRWPWVLLGLPSLGTGLVETTCWLVLGYAILRLGAAHKRRKLEDQRRALEQENLRTARHLYQEVFGEGDLSVVDETVAEDFIDHSHHCRGPQAFKRTIAGLRERLPDLQLCVEKQIADGEEITTRCVLSGTDVGGVLWYPPTHKHATLRVSYIDRYCEGKLVEHWEKAETRDLLEQLGLP
jgi:predicted ester cyclase